MGMGVERMEVGTRMGKRIRKQDETGIRMLLKQEWEQGKCCSLQHVTMVTTVTRSPAPDRDVQSEVGADSNRHGQ